MSMDPATLQLSAVCSEFSGSAEMGNDLLVGTPSAQDDPLAMLYAAPEQLDGSPPHPSLDTWGLGCTFYLMLKGNGQHLCADTKEQAELHAKIDSTLNFPKSPYLKSLLQSMLIVPKNSRPDMLRVLEHDFFRGGVSGCADSGGLEEMMAALEARMQKQLDELANRMTQLEENFREFGAQVEGFIGTMCIGRMLLWVWGALCGVELNDKASF